jgi:hypothetical protein
MALTDTTAEADALQLAIHCRMGPAGRLRVALGLSDLAHEFFVAGCRARHPDLVEADLQREVLRELYGAAIPD